MRNLSPTNTVIVIVSLINYPIMVRLDILNYKQKTNDVLWIARKNKARINVHAIDCNISNYNLYTNLFLISYYYLVIRKLLIWPNEMED